jgi:hypothetical protein
MLLMSTLSALWLATFAWCVKGEEENVKSIGVRLLAYPVTLCCGLVRMLMVFSS